MKKNVAGQKVGVQMITAADGAAFTGAVTVEVTIDAGTQATGTVGSGACTHEGNGYHTYAPSQAETNGDLLAFTFHGTGAVPVTVQVYTSFPQTVDIGATVAEPGQGAPAATLSIIDKISYLYKAWRNRTTQTASEYALYNDDATTKGQKAAVTSDGTTTDKAEVGTGA